MNKKEKQYQKTLNAMFNKEGYLVSNMDPTKIRQRVVTAVNIAIGDDGFRSKEIAENFDQLMEMSDERYSKQVKFYG